VERDLVGVDEVAVAVSEGDRVAFTRCVERHRRALRVHCYRLVGSVLRAEELVDETYRRAWRHLADGPSRLGVEDGLGAEMVGFHDPRLLPTFGLGPTTAIRPPGPGSRGGRR
jgi:hypothetical protein